MKSSDRKTSSKEDTSRYQVDRLKSGSMKLPITLSIGFHSLLIGLMLFTPHWRRIEANPVISVNIISEAPVAPPPKPQPKVEPEKPKPVVEQPKPDPPKEEKVEPPKPDPKAEALEKLKKRQKERDEIKKIASIPTPTPSKQKPTPLPTRDPRFVPLSDVSEPVPTSTAETSETTQEQVAFSGGFKELGYADRLKRAILNRWDKPIPRSNDDYKREGTVEFDIDSMGYIQDVRITTSSGWDELDNSVREAIEGLEKFEAPPSDSFSGGNLGVRYNFRLKEYSQ